MSLYALVHGGAHGGWCWELLGPELEARGHTVVAPDLPIEDPEAGALEWAETMVAAIEHVWPEDDADVVVVGHSLGGLATPVVASLRPVRRLVFLAAMVPVPGQSYVEYLATEPGAVTFAAEPRPDDELREGSVSWLAARRGLLPGLSRAAGPPGMGTAPAPSPHRVRGAMPHRRLAGCAVHLRADDRGPSSEPGLVATCGQGTFGGGSRRAPGWPLTLLFTARGVGRGPRRLVTARVGLAGPGLLESPAMPIGGSSCVRHRIPTSPVEDLGRLHVPRTPVVPAVPADHLPECLVVTPRLLLGDGADAGAGVPDHGERFSRRARRTSGIPQGEISGRE